MVQVVAINGSPRMEKGNTALVLREFIDGMIEGGSNVELFYASRLEIKPCACGRLYCWNDKPGECCIHDEMQSLLSKIKAADILVLATPVYIPLPGDMQNFINRLCPLLDPVLVNRDGRTRARFREDVNVKKIVLVATSGWWELGNLDTVVRIVQELAEDASVEFGGAVLRPHSSMMTINGKITEDGKSVLDAAQRAGFQLIKEGKMQEETLHEISRPLISEEDFAK
jgi:multimeric flavodoxin WrbA